MEQLMMLSGRNAKIYIRDRGAVFFSFLSALVVICLMVFFLGDMNVDDITRIVGAFSEKEYEQIKGEAKLLVLAWTFAGIQCGDCESGSVLGYDQGQGKRETERNLYGSCQPVKDFAGVYCLCMAGFGLYVYCNIGAYGILRSDAGNGGIYFDSPYQAGGDDYVKFFRIRCVNVPVIDDSKDGRGMERFRNGHRYVGGISGRHLYSDRRFVGRDSGSDEVYAHYLRNFHVPNSYDGNRSGRNFSGCAGGYCG